MAYYLHNTKNHNIKPTQPTIYNINICIIVGICLFWTWLRQFQSFAVVYIVLSIFKAQFERLPKIWTTKWYLYFSFSSLFLPFLPPLLKNFPSGLEISPPARGGGVKELYTTLIICRYFPTFPWDFFSGISFFHFLCLNFSFRSDRFNLSLYHSENIHFE